MKSKRKTEHKKKSYTSMSYISEVTVEVLII